MDVRGGEGDSKAYRTELLVDALLVGNALAFLWSHRFLPLLDYPDWLFEGYVFSSLLRGQPLPDYSLVAVPVPNAVSTVVIGLLAVVVPPEVAGKLFLTTCVLLFLAGARSLVRSVAGAEANPLGYLPTLLVFGFPFFHGYVNYLFGLSVLMFGMGYVIRRRHELATINPWAIGSLGVVLYFSHASTYFMWTVFVGLYVLFDFSHQALRRCLIAWCPSLVLLVTYSVHRLLAGDISVAVGVSGAEFFKGKLASMAAYLAGLQGFYPFLDGHEAALDLAGWLNLVFIGVFCLLGGFGAFAAIRERDHLALVTAAGSFGFLFIASPVGFAGLVSPGERFLYPALILLLAYAARTPSRASALRLMAQTGGPLLVVLGLLQAAFLLSYVSETARQLEQVYEQLRTVGLGADVRVVREDHFDFEGTFEPSYHKPFYLPLHPVLSRLPYYLALADGRYVPIFETGLFVSRTVQRQLSSATALRTLTDRPDAIVIVGRQEGNRIIARFLVERYNIVLDEQYVLVMKAQRATDQQFDRRAKRDSADRP